FGDPSSSGREPRPAAAQPKVSRPNTPQDTSHLGARSILADPRRAEMRDVVNDRVKHREWFRPFAPSVLDERGADYFVDYRADPFMLLVETVRPDRRDEIPAVTHVDGTGRLQSVTEAFHPLLYRLIREFDRLTGVLVVLNTSFNVRGEPMVNRPEEALTDFARTAMDALVMGDYVVEKAHLAREADERPERSPVSWPGRPQSVVVPRRTR
ncbi:MAG: carbamoyltransferase C-terminal domain-containing protein, partial [Acidimicrobiales bacterium]